MYVQMHVHKIISLRIAVDKYLSILKRRARACSKHDNSQFNEHIGIR